MSRPRFRCQLTEVDELEVDVEVFALEQRHRGLEVVARLRLHAQLVALDLRLDALGTLVTDDLADLLGVLLRDAVLDGRGDPVFLATGDRLAGLEEQMVRPT